MIAEGPDRQGHVWVPQQPRAFPDLDMRGFSKGLAVCGVRRCLRCARLFPYNRQPEVCEGYWLVRKVNDNGE